MKEDIQKYIRCMEEIKHRDRVIESNLNGENSTGQPMTDVEFVCMQFRKIAELIILSALCVYKGAYLKMYRDIEKEWNANNIRKKLERIHPEFYPVPFERVINPIMQKPRNKRIRKGFLTKKECIDLIGKCGNILHAFNPYNDMEKYNQVELIKSNFPEWQRKIRKLLHQHEIKLFGTDKQLWVYMFNVGEDEVLVEERVRV